MTILNRILVIEDDFALARTIQNVLLMEDFDVSIADSGASGIQKAFEYNPDLILCDINMHPIDGYQVLSVLKESQLTDCIPFIFITGKAELQDIRTGMDLGADDYFIKPFSNENLVRSIKRKLLKFKKIESFGKKEFEVLWKISPNGIFLLNGQKILDANPTFMRMVGVSESGMNSIQFRDLLNPESYALVEERIDQCSSGLLDFFRENVLLLPLGRGNMIDVTLFVSVYRRCSNRHHLLGLAMPRNLGKSENPDSKIFGTLSDASIPNRSDLIDLRLDDKFHRRGSANNEIRNDFFSNREAEVLRLSMEGLPMKVIADKLSIYQKGDNNIVSLPSTFVLSGYTSDLYGYGIQQYGARNTGTVNQGTALQTVSTNNAGIWQFGDDNTGTINQYSNSNTAYLIQLGGSNGASITQESGSTNVVNLKQDGIGGEAEILQHGTGNVVKGIGLDEMATSFDGSTLDIEQWGTTNTLNLQQADGASATVYQNGTSNISTVIQNQ